MKVRDSQRSKFWAARNKVRFIPGANLKFSDFKTASRYALKAWNSPWTKKHFFDATKRNCTILPKWNRWYEPFVINIPKWARCEMTVLEMVAHALNESRDKHGRNFCKIYLKLVQHFAGKETATELKAAFKENRVKFHSKKKVTKETLESLKDRGKMLSNRRRWISQDKKREEHLEFIKSLI